MRRTITFLKRLFFYFTLISLGFVAIKAIGIFLKVNTDSAVTLRLLAQETALWIVTSICWFGLFMLMKAIEFLSSSNTVERLTSPKVSQILRNALRAPASFVLMVWSLLLTGVSKLSRFIRSKFGNVGHDIRRAVAGEYDIVEDSLNGIPGKESAIAKLDATEVTSNLHADYLTTGDTQSRQEDLTQDRSKGKTKNKVSVFIGLWLIIILGGIWFVAEKGDDLICFGWKEELAKQGDAEAQYEYAQDCLPATAASWWHMKAAEQGYAPAQAQIGLMYLAGNGGPENKELALKWSRMAAEQGDQLAQASLGILYEFTYRNDAEAYVWYSLCAASPLGSECEGGQSRVAANLTRRALKQAQQRATQLYEQIYDN